MQNDIENEVIKIKNNKILFMLMIILPLVLALLSFTFLSSKTSSKDFHKETIQSLQTKQDNILKLSASTAGLAAGASIVLGDRVAPISNKLLDMTGYFVIILCAIMLEKYLAVLMGMLSFKIMIPIACLLFSIFTIFDKKAMRLMAFKVFIFAILAFCIIPISIKISNIIEETYVDMRIENIITESDALNNEFNIEKEQGSNSDTNNTDVSLPVEDTDIDNKGLLSSIRDLFTNAKDAAVSTVGNVVSGVLEHAEEWIDKLTRQLNNLIETIAIMLITTCVIPILIFFCFIWLIKLLFNKDLNINIKKLKK